MDKIPNAIVDKILRTGKVVRPDGSTQQLNDGIGPEFAGALFRTIAAHRPKVVVEVGMGFGVSSLAILSALEENGGDGRLISIDPHQRTDYESLGLYSVVRAGLAGRLELLEEPSFLALPRLLRDEPWIDFGYIDGWHTFDYCLLDFFYIDRMLRPQGVVGFNDAGWPSVSKVLRYVTRHRRYDEIMVGLGRRYRRGKHPAKLLANAVLRRPSVDRYFQKTAQWEPNWDFYRRF